jgi:mannose-6-phosphate isomerase-like protein (cupin superfamily)
VNKSVIRLAVIEGEFHWHQHDKEDEFFFVLDGHLLIDLEEKSIELKPKQGFVVPKGIIHRTRAQIRTSVIIVEDLTVKPIGD